MFKSRDRSTKPALATATVEGWEVLATSLTALSHDDVNKTDMMSAITLITCATNLGIGSNLLVAGARRHPWFFLNIRTYSIHFCFRGGVETDCKSPVFLS